MAQVSALVRRMSASLSLPGQLSMALALVALTTLVACAEGPGVNVIWTSRTTPTGFELSRNGGPWTPFWPIGVNFGMALPGHSPGEFLATRAQIRRWLGIAASSGANCIRIYTVQSPEFYQELRAYNLDHEDKPLLLMQGAWIKEPEGFGPDYLSAATAAWVRDEIDKAVDCVHGDRTIEPGTPANPTNYGRAFGTFDADVSPWLIGWLFGSELEPYTIESTLAKHPAGKLSYKGRFLSIEGKNPIEAWVVEQMDRIVKREHDRYGAQHPIGFSSWPTLDPLTHWTEPKMPVSAEDTYQIDLEPVVEAADFKAGLYMSYHAYPYYPDFIIYQPEYQGYSDEQGKFPYLGYLDELRQHYDKHALIIAEIGHPSSQGNGHQTPSGQDHGGFAEHAQGPAVLRSVAAIAQSGLDGAFVFAIIDEWFKRAWVVERVEQPADQRRMWHNVMNPEQNYGLIALAAGPAKGRVVIDGADTEWTSANATAAAGSQQKLGDGHDDSRRLRDLSVRNNAAYLFVRVRLQPPASGVIDWSKVDVVIAFDTIDPARGDTRLDPAGAVGFGRGVEHILRIHHGSDAQLLVDKPFDLYGLWHGFRESYQKYRTTANNAGEFLLVRTVTNAAYEVKDAKTGKWTALGVLQDQETGRFHVGNELSDSHANVAIDAKTGVIEARIPWNLLHFTDPSTLTIVDDDGSAGARHVTTTTTTGVAVAAVVLGGSGEEESALADSIPAASKTATGFGLPAQGWVVHTWKPWVEPVYHERVKPAVAALGAGLPTVLPASIAFPTAKSGEVAP